MDLDLLADRLETGQQGVHDEGDHILLEVVHHRPVYQEAELVIHRRDSLDEQFPQVQPIA